MEMKDNQIDSKSAEIKKIYLQKVTYLSNMFIFTNKYSTSLIGLHQKFVDYFTEELLNLYNNDIKSNLKYIKEISNLFISYSSELSKINNPLTRLSEENNECLGSFLLKHQNNLCETLNNCSSFIKNDILNDPLYENIENFPSRVENINKETNKMLAKIERRIYKTQNLYKTEFENIEENFKNNYNSQKIWKIINEMPEFIFIEAKSINYINKLFGRIGVFLNNIHLDFVNLINSLSQYYSLVKNSLTIYIANIKNLLSEDIVNPNNDIENYFISTLPEEIEKKLSIYNILIKKSNFFVDSFNNIFVLYQDSLMQTQLINNQMIYDNSNFDIKKYTTFSSFMKFLINTMPKQREPDFSTIIKNKFEVKYDPGVFKNWTQCHIIITKQEHLLLYEKEINEKENLIFNLKNLEINTVKDKTFLINLVQKGKSNLLIDTINQSYYDQLVKMLSGKESQKENKPKKENNTNEIIITE